MAEDNVTSSGIKVLVSGSRDWEAWDDIEREFERIYSAYGANVTLIHGDARGADRMAAHVAEKKRWAVQPMAADWDRHGRKAGVIRNVEMLDQDPDLIIAFRLDKSRGTTHLINIAREAGYNVKVIERETPPEEKEETMEITKEELQAMIGAAVMAAQGVTAQVATPKADEAVRYSTTVKDVEGNPVKLNGNGVQAVNGMAQRGCNNCGTGNVAWVLSKKTYGADHPKAGQQVPYLAQAYSTEEGIKALKWQAHTTYCQGGGASVTPVSTQEHRDAESVEETDKEVSIDDKLEADRAPSGTFDSFAHAEVDELGTDVGMGFLVYSDLNDMAKAESE